MTTPDPNDEAFDHFFPEEMRQDAPAGAPAPANSQPDPEPRRRGLAAPVTALFTALLALAVVGGLVIKHVNGGDDAQAEDAQSSSIAPPPSQAPTTSTPAGATATSAAGQSPTQAPSTPQISQSTSTSTSTTTVSPTSSPSSAPSSSSVAPHPTDLPGGLNKCNGKIGVGPRTSCDFAYAVAEKAGGAEGNSQFKIRAHSPKTGKDYDLVCIPGEYVVCVTPTGASVTIVRA